MTVRGWSWLLFAGVVAVSLAIDLYVHRGSRALDRKRSIAWSIVWIVVSLLFAGWIAIEMGTKPALAFLTAYLVEKSLSVDNLFVFLVLFRRLEIPRADQHRVLFWGILGAFVTRALFIVGGTALLARWHVAVYVLGAFLVFTGLKTLRSGDRDAGEGRILPFLRRHLPFTATLHEHRFIVVEHGRRVVTPLFLALLAIETTDVLFAIDSIAAVLAISRDPFIVFTSNVFAILGLRALYLVLADLVADLAYLHYGLGAILVFVGLKMLASRWIELPHWASLAITAAILVAAVVPSLIVRRRRAHGQRPA